MARKTRMTVCMPGMLAHAPYDNPVEAGSLEAFDQYRANMWPHSGITEIGGSLLYIPSTLTMASFVHDVISFDIEHAAGEKTLPLSGQGVLPIVPHYLMILCAGPKDQKRRLQGLGWTGYSAVLGSGRAWCGRLHPAGQDARPATDAQGRQDGSNAAIMQAQITCDSCESTFSTLERVEAKEGLLSLFRLSCS